MPLLSIGELGSWSAPYYTELAGREDYYIGTGAAPEGRWFGVASDHLGLEGRIVSKSELSNVLAGFSPDGKRKLVQNAGSKNRDLGWDLTFSAPKSVSILWALSPAPIQRQIERAMEGAVKKAIAAYVDKVATFSRRGKAGHERVAANLLVALFPHGTSRALDPNLHTHCLVPNVCLSEDGKTRSVDSWHLYQHKMAAGALFRVELGKELRQRLGVVLSRVKSWFELSGVPKRLRQIFSSRRADIEEMLYELGEDSPEAAAVVASLSRSAKEQPSRSELFGRWRRAARLHQFTQQDAIRLLGREHENEQTPRLDTLISDSLSELTRQQSSFSEHQFVRELAERCQGFDIGLDAILTAVTHTLSHSPEIVQLKSKTLEPAYTTRRHLALEKEALDVLHRAKSMPGIQAESKTVGDVATSLLPNRLTHEQQRAFLHLTRAHASIRVVTGFAGTGKSFLLSSVRNAFVQDGFQMIGACLAAKTGEDLERSTQIPTSTVHSLLWRIENARTPILTDKTVLVIDEAGMVGTAQFRDLLQAAERARSTVLLTGDAQQLQSIEAGGVLAAACQILGNIHLENITRQRPEHDPAKNSLSHWKRQAVKDMAYGKAAKALRPFAEKGLLTITPTIREAGRALIQDWAKQGLDNPQENMILVSTNVEASTLNRLCQAMRLKTNPETANEYLALNRERLYRGDRILFTRNAKRDFGVNNGDMGEITALSQALNSIHVRLDKGSEVVISLDDYQDIRLGWAFTTHKAQGATVDAAYVLIGNSIQDRHSSYVQVSRARETTRIYTSNRIAGAEMERLVKAMSRDRSKRLAHSLDS